jgi:small GTP-binding protein
MSTIQKKVCMLGAFAVGKTSLVARFVHSVYSDKYLTTVGAKIDKKEVQVGDTQVRMILWDLHGEDDFQSVRVSYLRGMSAYLLVLDGTRRQTLDTARELHQRARDAVGDVPFVCAINKADLSATWEIQAGDLAALKEEGWVVLETSAKTGGAVDSAFEYLAEAMVNG